MKVAKAEVEAEEVSAMSKRLVVSIVAVLAAGMSSPLLRAQDEKWNNDPAEAGRLTTGKSPAVRRRAVT